MRRLSVLSLGFFVVVLPLTALAADFDGSVPLICAVTDSMECDPKEECHEREVNEIDAPRFIRVDFAGKKLATVRSGGEDRITAIKQLERVEGVLVLQGAENGRGWTMAISEETGNMSGSVVGDELAFVVFGACTPD